MEGRLDGFADSDDGLEFGCEDDCLEDIVGGVRPAVGSEVRLAFGRNSAAMDVQSAVWMAWMMDMTTARSLVRILTVSMGKCMKV